MISRILISAFYRIMPSKAREVHDFINNDLLHIVSEAFGDGGETDNAELKWAQTQKQLEDLHVLFMHNDRYSYIDKLLNRQGLALRTQKPAH